MYDERCPFTMSIIIRPQKSESLITYLLILRTQMNHSLSYIVGDSCDVLAEHRCCCCQPTPPCLLGGGGGESVSVALWGFAASFSHQSSSRAATPEGSLHKSKADSDLWPTEEMLCGMFVSATKGTEW